jgi:hypothetical protein
VGHGHDSGVLDAVVVVGNIRHLRNTRVGDQSKRELGPEESQRTSQSDRNKIMLTKMDVGRQYEQVHDSLATRTTRPSP